MLLISSIRYTYSNRTKTDWSTTIFMHKPTMMLTPTLPQVSIIIRCYNEAQHVGRLLHGIAQQTMDEYEVILVDSGSTDGTRDVARKHGFDDIVYISPEDFSFGRALNYGCNAATGEFCVISSAHVYPKRNDWLEKLLEKFTDGVALVYGKQRGNEVTSFSENEIFKQWFPEHDIERQDHPFCNNANAAIRRDLWEEFPYNERLTGLEEVAWAKQIRKVGYDVSYASEAEVIHVHDETIREIYNRYRREAYAHKQILPDHSFSMLDFLRLSVLHVISDYRAAVKAGKFSSNLLEIPKFRLLQFAGTYRGFAQEGPISEELWQRFYYPNRNDYPDKNIERNKRGDSSVSSTHEIEYPDSAKFTDASADPSSKDHPVESSS